MPLARIVSGDRVADLLPAFDRLGLPTAAREYVLEKIPQFQVLLTGVSKDEARWLRSVAEGQSAPGHEEFPSYVPGDRERRPGTALLSGRRQQFVRLIDDARREAATVALASAVDRALRSDETPEPIQLGDTALTFGGRTLVMGVINVTPDSFSDGGKFAETDAAVAQGAALAEAGADVLDVGGESTRPGSRKVSAHEEIGRVVPVIRGLREKTRVPISIDTTKAEVAAAAMAAGATMVNDISGFGFDPEMASVAARARAAVCLMHIQGTPETMQKDPRYGDVVEEVLGFLSDAIDRATKGGVALEQISIDPGIGFGKTPGHNLFLLRRARELRVLGRPVVIGPSRKSFIGHLTGGKPASERLFGTAGSVAGLAVMGGADMVRVHDVAELKDALAVADAVRVAREGGDLYGPRGG